MTLRRGLASTTGMLLLGLALFYSIRYWPSRTPLLVAPEKSAAASRTPDYLITDFHAIDLDTGGRIRYELTAEKLSHFAEPERADLVAPEMVFYRNIRDENDDAPTLPWQLSADIGQISDRGQRLDLAGHVSVTRVVDDPVLAMEMQTTHLTVLGQQEHASTNAPVTLQSQRASLAATGMDIDFRKGRMELHSRVRGQYVPE